MRGAAAMARDAPVLLDLFCGAGGAAMGYHHAGFRVVGVDLRPQPRYPFEFHQADALTFPLDGVDVVHASPPCQSYSVSKGLSAGAAPRLIREVRQRLASSGRLFVIENVAGAWAEMPAHLALCGTMFGLQVYRHRLFESNMLLFSPTHPAHPRHLLPGYMCVYGHVVRGRQSGNHGNRYDQIPVAAARAAMGIEWMTLAELSQAIPPAYTEWLGRQLLAALAAGQVA